MSLIQLLESAQSYLNALDQLQKTRTKIHHRRKVIYGHLNADDIYLHKEAFAKKIAQSIQSRTFQYQPLTESIIKAKNKLRSVYPHFISDHLVQSVIQKYLMKKIDPLLSDSLMSYRKGYSARQACHQLCAFIQEATHHNKIDLYIVQTDLQNYTDTIPVGSNEPIWKKIKSLREDDYTWELIRSALQATYKEEGTSFCKLYGIPMGSPITSLIANLYLNQLDHELADIDGGLYLRFGDDILFSHTDPALVTQVITQIKDEISELGLQINADKTKFTYLTCAGRPTDILPFRGSSTVRYLGHSVHANGNLSLKPKKETDFINDIKSKIKYSSQLLSALPAEKKGPTLCEMLNHTFLNTAAPDTSLFLQRIQAINHRGILKRMDYLIALEVAKFLTHNNSVKAFREIPYKRIRNEFGLISLCQLKNNMDRYGRHKGFSE